jgi:hypothetical protein
MDGHATVKTVGPWLSFRGVPPIPEQNFKKNRPPVT